jgi:RNA-directed DNA polymerase
MNVATTIPDSEPLSFDSQESIATILEVASQDLARVLHPKNRGAYYREHTIAKSNGASRTIHAVSGDLKLIQRKLLDLLQERYEPTAYAHGFVPKRSIVTNAMLHRKKRLILKIDIKDFFPSIAFGRVLGMFKASPFNFPKDAAIVLAQIVCLPDGTEALPQGGVTSPYVANMLVRRMDRRLASLAKENHCVFTRYADDITFSTNDTKSLSVDSLVEAIYTIISEEGFLPNIEKTRLLRKSDRQIVTGIVVNQHLNVNRLYFRSVRATIHKLERAKDIRTEIAKTDFKDDRATRSGLSRDGDGKFLLGNKKISDDHAVEFFFRHFTGRLHFIHHVLRSNALPPRKGVSGANEPEVMRSSALASLYLRSYQILLTTCKRYKRLMPLKHSLASAIRKSHTLIDAREKLDLSDQSVQDRTKSLDEYVQSPIYQQLKLAIAAIDGQDSLKQFKQAYGSDPRIYRLTSEKSEDLNACKKALNDIARWPPFSLDATKNILSSLNTGELADIFHEPRIASEPFTPTEVLSRFSRILDPCYYKVHEPLRASLDGFVNIIRAWGNTHGLDSTIDLLNDRDIGPRTAELQRQIRFSDPDVDDIKRSSSLFKTIQRVLTKSKEDAEQKTVHRFKRYVKKFDETKFFSFRPSLEDALKHIFRSVFEHAADDDTVFVGVGPYQAFSDRTIRIGSPQNSNIGCAPGKEFARGDLLNAVFALNGLARYFVDARFQDGKRYRVDMMTGAFQPSDATKGDQYFVHLICLD